MNQPIEPAQREPKASAVPAQTPPAPAGRPDLPGVGIDAPAGGLESLERHADFYDFSPSGLISLERDATIAQINLSGARLLGLERDRCKGKQLDAFVDSADRNAFSAFLQQVFATEARQSCEIALAGKDRPSIDVHIDAMLVPDKTVCLVALMDITPHKRALAALQEGERFFRDSQRAAFIGSYKLCFLTDHWSSSEVLDQIFGIDDNFDRSLQGWLHIVHPDDREMMDQYFREEVISNRRPFSREYRIIRKSDGQTRWVNGLGQVDFDAQGQPISMTGTIQDITERKQADQALHDSEQRYAALFEAAAVPMYVFASDTQQILAVNQAAIECYGYSAGEFLSMTIFDIRIEAEHSLLRQNLANKAQRRQGIWRYRRKDGSVFPAQAIAQAIEYAGRAARFVVALDITAQTQAEKAVAEQLSTLQRAADAAQAIAWHQTLKGALQEVADQARGVISAHQAVVSLTAGGDWAQTISALSLSEKYAQYRGLNQPMDGSGIHALISETSHAMRLTQAELEAHPRWRGFGSYAGKHPTMRGWLAVPLMGRDGKNIGLLQLSDKFEGEFTQSDEYVALELAQLASAAIENARLIEEVGRLNSGLEQKVAERTMALHLANQELEAFSYSVSHDLRSPLNTIDGFSQLLARQLAESGNEKVRHYLSRIQAGAKQMGQLIADLLALAKISRTQMQHVVVDLSALASSIADDLLARQGERQVALHIESGLHAEGDAGLLRVVLENLLGNAWKYSSKQAAAEISFGRQLNEAGEPVFFVRDNGAGFDMAYADKLFTPFQRLHEATEFAGTGIGLATVKRVIDRHGSRLWAESAPGLGATFYFTLPKGAAAL
ncbi:MAG: PAS domain-containing sensor histidine kinase [Polaromonas sp.]